jgi:hypothetical protein
VSLDFTRVAGQLQAVSERMAAEGRDHAVRLGRARQELASAAAAPDALAKRIDTAKTSWLLAQPFIEPLDGTHEVTPPPSDYIVVATDGSHIDVDRHIPVRCYLLNLGWAIIGYGAYAGLTDLSSEPSLGITDEELTLSDDEDASREERVAGSFLSALRAVEEIRRLADLVEKLPADAPTLALLDGTLVLWGLSFVSVSSRARRRILDDGVLAALGRLRDLAEQRPLAVASYISYPGSAEVTNMLRISACPVGRDRCPVHNVVHDDVTCNHCPGHLVGQAYRPCDGVAGCVDRDLFQSLLGYGDRSPVVLRHPGERDYVYEQYREHGHDLASFYLRTPEGVPDEVARVEMPVWSASDPERVSLTHSLLIDQCRRGLGYPVAVMEAHEQAVIDGPSREFFRQLLENSVAGQRTAFTVSAKNRSKRGRWL